MMKKLWKRVAAAAIAGVIAFSFVGVVKAHDYERLATDETSIMRFFPMFRMMMVHAQDAPRMVTCSATTIRQAACAMSTLGIIASNTQGNFNTKRGTNTCGTGADTV